MAVGLGNQYYTSGSIYQRTSAREPYYTSGTYYRKSQSVGLHTDKFHQSPGAAIRKNDIAAYNAAFSNLSSTVFERYTVESEETSILAVQKLEIRAAEEAEKEKSALLDILA